MNAPFDPRPRKLLLRDEQLQRSHRRHRRFELALLLLGLSVGGVAFLGSLW